MVAFAETLVNDSDWPKLAEIYWQYDRACGEIIAVGLNLENIHGNLTEFVVLFHG